MPLDEKFAELDEMEPELGDLSKLRCFVAAPITAACTPVGVAHNLAVFKRGRREIEHCRRLKPGLRTVE